MFMPDNTVFRPAEAPNMAPDRTKNQRLDMARRLTTFQEVEQTYTPQEAQREASRCMGCPSRWCSKECPAGMPVPEFIRAVRAGDYEAAYELIASASTLPEFCSRLCPQEKQCQSNCSRAIRSEAVGIGKLERFVVEQHYARPLPPAPAPEGKAVAVVGSGPSGLSAAQRLADKGYRVTVFESQPMAGGLLRYGIPGMKLEKDILDRKLQTMERQGVTFRTGVCATPETLAGFDAAILAVGAGNARSLQLEGAAGAKGIYPAVEFLSARPDAQGKDVVIVGGGDTGNDCVGTAIRLGAGTVTQIEMLPKTPGRDFQLDPIPGKPKEEKFDASQEEHLYKFLRDPHIYQATVKAVQTGVSGALESITLVRLAALWDRGRRLSLKEIPGSDQRLPCELLVIAAGFLGPDPKTAAAFGVETNARSNIADRHYQTSRPGLFACGDCRTGQSLVVKAMTDGRDCADAVDDYLKGQA